MMPSRSTIAAVCVLLIAASAACDVTPLPRGDAAAAACSACTIELQRVGQLSDSTEPGMLPDRMVYAARDRVGRIYTVSRSGNTVLVFDGDGKLLKRLGQPGAGPGEFRFIRRILPGPGDSVYLSDFGLGRMSVYDSTLTFIRSQPTPYPPSLLLDGGAYVSVALMPRPGDQPFQTVNADGSKAASFGADSAAPRASQGLILKRHAMKSGTGDIWAVAPGRYTLERWNPRTGARMQAIAVKSSWFKDIAEWPADETQRPPAVIEALWEDERGMLWAVIRDADTHWKAPTNANIERVILPEEYDATYDWVIEVVDPNTAAVIASRRFPNVLWVRPPSSVIVTAREGGSAFSVFDVWQPVLKDSASQREP